MEASLPPIACTSRSSEVSDLLFFLTLDTDDDDSHFSVELLFFPDQNSFSNEQSINKSKNAIRIMHESKKLFYYIATANVRNKQTKLEQKRLYK